MKRRDLIKLLEENGWYKKSEGGKHTRYTNGYEIEEIPRHREINKYTAKDMIKRRGLRK